jgi:thymidine phosphorylase
MRVVDLIRKKRDGGEHTAGEICFLVDSFTRGETPDYQMSAWLMAIVLRGASSAEALRDDARFERAAWL